MPSLKTYKKLSVQDKKLLINSIKSGESISKIALEAGISRTIIYKWLSAEQNLLKNPLLENKTKPIKHWRKMPLSLERKVINLWRNNPEYSLRTIAKSAHVSLGGAFKIIKKYQIDVQKAGKMIKRYARKNYFLFLPEQKIELIDRFYEGEPIAKICREVGISRTIFYKWLKEYGDSANKRSVLEKRNPKGEDHWRFMPEVRESILEIALQNPQFSLSQIAIAVRNEGKSISKSGLYYILKRMNLGNYQARLSYIASVSLDEDRPENLSSGGYSFSLGLARALPQFAVFTLFWFIAFFVSINTLSHPPNTNSPIAINKDIQINEVEDDNYSKKIESAKQDFKWGALSINSPKDRYETGENIELGFGVVDHAGNTICSAEIGLEILDSEGKAVFENEAFGHRVSPSGQCSLQNVTNTADYGVIIPALGKEGVYSLNVKAKTYEGESEFKHKLLIANSQPFEIERVSYPARIFPEAIYPVEIKIKANKDFKGTISDALPKGITASNILSGGVLSEKDEANESIIKWNVDLKKGDVYSISYSLHFPQVWPEFYEIGPLKFTESKTGNLVYQEGRYWQIVADAL